MHLGRTTLSKFLIQQLTGIRAASDLGALLVDVAAAVKAISAMTAKGALGGYLGEQRVRNAKSEAPQKIHVLAPEGLIRSCEGEGLLAWGMVSAEYARGRHRRCLILQHRHPRWARLLGAAP
jgi:fructose-1,6-bisphosphatase